MPRKKRSFVQAVGFALGCAPLLCHAFDSVSLELAESSKTRITRLGLQRNTAHRLRQYNGSHIAVYWDVGLAYWHATQYHDHPGETQNIFAFSLTPVLRLEPDEQFGPYAEIGVGAHLLSARYNNAGRELSTHFQFGTQLGAGYVFRNNFDISVHLQHVSNGGIREPNSGVNFAAVRIARRF